MNPILSIINALLVVVLIAIVIKKLCDVNNSKKKKYDYYEEIKQGDPTFQQELEIIYEMIISGSEDLNLICEEAKVSMTECVVKIRYLIKEKRLTDDYYIDHDNGFIKKCSKKDAKLLRKYRDYIYKNRYQVYQIAREFSKDYYKWDVLEKEIYEDIKYLVDNKLLNYIKIDEEKKKIIYPKRGNDYISKTCPSCGAINDVKRLHEARCKYCKSLIKGE